MRTENTRIVLDSAMIPFPSQFFVIKRLEFGQHQPSPPLPHPHAS